jgi:hypothetical protein
VNQVRWNRVRLRNETGARVLHDALQWLKCAWAETDPKYESDGRPLSSVEAKAG